jgi:hypothetical protein
VGDGEKLLTYLNSALKVLLGTDIFPRVPPKKLNFVPSVMGDPFHGSRLELIKSNFGSYTVHYRYVENDQQNALNYILFISSDGRNM